MKRNYLLFLEDISDWYFEVDEEIVWNVATQKLPQIKTQIDNIIKILTK